MSALLDAKFAELRARLIKPGCHQGALLAIYPPEDEHAFRRQYALLTKELAAKGVPHVCLPLRRLAFEHLERRGLLEKTFRLEFGDPAGQRQSLAGMLHRELVARLRSTAEAHPGAIVLLQQTAALYPWVSYSAVLEEIETDIDNAVVVPFPGTEDGPLLHFLGAKDGYNYRATRV